MYRRPARPPSDWSCHDCRGKPGDWRSRAAQPDGKIIAVGNSANNATGQSFIALTRYNP